MEFGVYCTEGNTNRIMQGIMSVITSATFSSVWINPPDMAWLFADFITVEDLR